MSADQPYGRQMRVVLVEPAVRPQRRWHQRRLVRAAALLVVVAIAMLGGGYWYVANPRRAAGLAGMLLESMTGADANIREAQFRLDGRIVLRDVELRLPDDQSEFARLFEAEKVVIRHDIYTLLKGDFHPTLIRFEQPIIHRTEDVRSGQINMVVLAAQAGPPTAAMLGTHLPEVQLNEGRVVFSEYDGRHVSTVRQERFEGHVEANTTQGLRYEFALQLQENIGTAAAKLTGSYNPQTHVFESRIEHFSITGPHRNWLPRKWRQWWDRHDPSGDVESMQLGFELERRRFYAHIRLADTELIPPFAPFVDAGIRMTDGSGLFKFTNDGVTIEALTGEIEGIAYRIDGSIDGFDVDAPLRLTFRADRFAIPDQPRHLLVMPQAVISQFRRFQPSGQLGAMVSLQRAAKGGPLQYEGKVSFHDVSAEFSGFPYRVEQIAGEVRFDEEQIEIVSLSGRGRTGAKVMIDGRIWPPGPDAADHIHITAVDVPFDEVLYGALFGKALPRAYRMFLNEERYRQLVDQKLVQTAESRQAIERELSALQQQRQRAEGDAAAELDLKIEALRTARQIPVFELGGTVNLKAVRQRPAGPNRKVTVTSTLDLAGLNVLFEYWPLPLQLEKGTLILTSDHAVAEGIVARGVNDQSMRFAAKGVVDGTSGRIIPDVQVAIAHLPIDELLLATLPEQPRSWLRALQLQGDIDLKGKVFADEDGHIDFQLMTELAGCQVKPFDGRYEVKIVDGQADVSRHEVNLIELAGQHHQTRLLLNGSMRWGQGRRENRLKIEGRAVRFEDPIVELFPPHEPARQKAAELTLKYQPRGLYDFELDYESTTGADAKLDLTLRPQHVEFDRGDQHITMPKLDGSIRLGDGRISFDKFAAEYDEGRFTISGHATLGEVAGYEALIDADIDQLGPKTRALLPAQFGEPLDKLQVSGGYGLRQVRFQFDPDGDSRRKMTLKGLFELRGASANVAIPLSDIHGQLDIDLRYDRDHAWPQLDAKLHAEQLKVLGRVIAPLDAKVTSTDDGGRLQIDEFVGRCYGGWLTAGGYVEPKEGYYRIDASLVDGGLGPIVKAGDDDAAEVSAGVSPDGDKAQGLISARLAVEGYVGRGAARIGRGELAIREARMYRLPLSLAILQLINLSFPAADAFDTATAEFLIDGDTVLLDHLSFDAPSVRVAGRGTLDYPSQKLDLRLVSSNPSNWDLGPITKLIATLKDELIGIHIGGTLTKPEARVASFTGAADSWKSIFESSKALPDDVNDAADNDQMASPLSPPPDSPPDSSPDSSPDSPTPAQRDESVTLGQ